jgi:hypothetical protein
MRSLQVTDTRAPRLTGSYHPRHAVDTDGNVVAGAKQLTPPPLPPPRAPAQAIQPPELESEPESEWAVPGSAEWQATQRPLPEAGIVTAEGLAQFAARIEQADPQADGASCSDQEWSDSD